MGYELDDEISIPCTGKRYCLLLRAQTGSWGPPSLLPNEYQGFPPRRREVDKSSPSIPDLKNGGAIAPPPIRVCLHSMVLN
jgi:hypothetical protein